MTPKHVLSHMSNETAYDALPADALTDAAEAFVDRARSHHGYEITKLYLFGSTVRGEAHGRASDVDVLLILNDDTDRDATASSLRDIAYDVMLEYGPVVEPHILSETMGQ